MWKCKQLTKIPSVWKQAISKQHATNTESTCRDSKQQRYRATYTCPLIQGTIHMCTDREQHTHMHSINHTCARVHIHMWTLALYQPCYRISPTYRPHHHITTSPHPTHPVHQSTYEGASSPRMHSSACVDVCIRVHASTYARASNIHCVCKEAR